MRNKIEERIIKRIVKMFVFQKKIEVFFYCKLQLFRLSLRLSLDDRKLTLAVNEILVTSVNHSNTKFVTVNGGQLTTVLYSDVNQYFGMMASSLV